jgi:site-specific recombinase XerC
VLGPEETDIDERRTRPADSAKPPPIQSRCPGNDHLLRQGEALSTIQEVLGHCTAETTQRYVVTDVVLLRQVLEESKR